MELEDIRVDDDVPHLDIRPNSVRILKTPHSERKLPLVGVSLEAAKELVRNGGWSAKRHGKNMSTTSAINKWLKENQIFEEKG